MPLFHTKSFVDKTFCLIRKGIIYDELKWMMLEDEINVFTTMSFMPSISPITESDEELERLLSDPGVELPPLLPSIAFATGDLSFIPSDIRLDPSKTLEEQGGLTPDEQSIFRMRALEGLKQLRDNTNIEPVTRNEDLRTIMSWACGTNLEGSYLQMMMEELAPGDRDLRAPKWNIQDYSAEPSADRIFNVAIIGGGMSGILAAYRLKQAGIKFVLFEKNGDTGGTWLENTYPGCRVDVSNHVYSYSFMQKHNWPHYHSTQDVLLNYFNDCATEFGIRENIRFNSKVTGISWDEKYQKWDLNVMAWDEECWSFTAVISAVGQLNQPSYPAIPGIDDFEGTSWHSARWNHNYDLRGKRVAVLGTGCSAVQFIPRVAEQAEQTTIFQRTPNWLMPRPQYQQSLPESLVWCFTHIPNYHNWFRLHLFWRSHEGLLSRLEIDESWEDPGDSSISAANHELGVLLRMYLESEFADRPDLLEKVTPTYTMGAKRFVIDDGLWAKTLHADNVELCTDPIVSISSSGITTESEDLRDFDAIIYGTGFKAADFLMPMTVTGRNGVNLHDQWDGDARAYLGIVAPNFPNLFFLYGPNTNIVINGSIIYFSECEVHYITQCLKHMLKNQLSSLDVKTDVHDKYNEVIDEGNRRMAWGLSDVNSWYKNASGRTAQNWPFSLLEYWEQPREINSDDYNIV